LQRYGTVEETANLAVFLAAAESSFFDGAVYGADSGLPQPDPPVSTSFPPSNPRRYP